MSPTTATNIIDHSLEYLDHTVAQLYQTFLGRGPDGGGLNFFATQLQQGQMTVQQVETILASSAEMYHDAGSTAAGWIDALYEDVLERAADQGGLSHWTAFLSQTGDRQSVACALTNSSEAAQREIQNVYQDLLTRPADQGGLAYWTQQLQQGTTYVNLVANLAGSHEYYQKHIKAPVMSLADGTTTIVNGGSDSFGTVVEASTTTHTYTVTNTGSAALSITAVNLPNGYSLQSSLPSSIAPGASASFVVALDTSSIGTYSGTMSITDNDMRNDPFNVSLSASVTSVPLFTPNSDAQYITLTQDITSAGDGLDIGANTVVNLNGHTITFGTGGTTASGIGITCTIAGQALAGPVIIENGTIVQGNDGSNAPDSVGIGGPDHLVTSPNILISNVTVRVTGEDSKCFYANWGYGVQIVGCHFYDGATSTANRMNIPSNIDALAHTTLVENSVIVGGDTAIKPGSNSIIRDNIIAPGSFAVNGFGVMNYETTGTDIEDNVIIPVSPDGTSPAAGRGVALNGADDITVKNNVIMSQLTPTAEDGPYMRAAGVMARWGAANNTVTGNDILVIGGNPFCQAAGLYILDTGTGNVFENNTVNAIAFSETLPGDAPGAYATALMSSKHGVDSSLGGMSSANDVIDDNVFGSNNWIMALDEPSGFEGTDLAQPMVGNTLEFIDPTSTLSQFAAAAAAKATQIGMALDTTQNSTFSGVQGLLPTVDITDTATIHVGPYDGTATLLGTTLLNGASLSPSGVEVHIAPSVDASPVFKIGVGATTVDYYSGTLDSLGHESSALASLTREGKRLRWGGQ